MDRIQAAFKVSDEQIPLGDPVLLHIIKLLEFNRILQNTKEQYALNGAQKPLITGSLRIPVQPKPATSVKRISSETKLTKASVNLLIKRAIILIMAANDTEVCSEFCIDMLCDLLAEHLRRTCLLLKKHVDTKQLKQFQVTQLETQQSNHQLEFVEKLLEDVGESLPAIHHFYTYQSLHRDRILRTANRLCAELQGKVHCQIIDAFGDAIEEPKNE